MLTTSVQRYVSDFGETLIVRDHFGVKVLTDPVDDHVAVIVPSGRRAVLVQFVFDGLECNCGRNSDVIVVTSDCRLGFASVRYPGLRVFLRDLPEGQCVDILPATDAVAAYVHVPCPLPVLRGTVSLPQSLIYHTALAA